MNKPSIETIGVRYMGRAALHKDPLEDHVEYTCPHCGLQGMKNARRAPADYHFVDGFVQDLRGEATTCRRLQAIASRFARGNAPRPGREAALSGCLLTRSGRFEKLNRSAGSCYVWRSVFRLAEISHPK